MSKCLENAPECIELILRIILGKTDLKVVKSQTEYPIKSLQGRGVRFAGQWVWQRDCKTLAKKWKKRIPDAIVCSSDLVAAHVLNLLRKLGKSCPKDVLLTGVNDVDLATLVSPPPRRAAFSSLPTSLSANRRRAAKTAARWC